LHVVLEKSLQASASILHYLASIVVTPSQLMDRATPLGCEAQWGEEDRQTLRELPRLNAEEGAL